MTDENVDIERALAGLLTLALLLPVSAVTTVIYQQMWRWFVVPLGVADVGFWHMFGLTVLVAALTKNAVSAPDKKDIWGPIQRMLLIPVLAFAFGALAHWGMTL